jgi:hypothetical protein
MAQDSPGVIQLRPLRSILPMYIPHRRRKKIHPSSNEILHLVRRRQHTLHSLRISNPILPALDPAGLSLTSDPPSMTIGDQFFRFGEVVGFLVVRHVDHYRVEGERVGCQAYQVFILAVIEVDCDGDCGSRGGFCGCADQEAVGCCYGPGKDLDY